jgi:rhodanese-related sulfurtransferase
LDVTDGNKNRHVTLASSTDFPTPSIKIMRTIVTFFLFSVAVFFCHDASVHSFTPSSFGLASPFRPTEVIDFKLPTRCSARSIATSVLYSNAIFDQHPAIAHSFSPSSLGLASQSRPSRNTKLHAAIEGKNEVIDIELATRDAVTTALRDPRTVILDARSWEEIEKADGAYLKPRLTGQRWMQVAGCTPQEAPLLKLAAKSMLPDPSAPVVVYCASGKRAARARQTLLDQGYADVLNLGGTKELEDFMP